MDIIVGTGLFIVTHAVSLIGFALPPVVQYLNREVPRGHERFIVTILVCLLCAVLIQWNALMTGSPENIAFTLGLIFFESQVVYRLYFKNSYFATIITKDQILETPSSP